MADDSQRGRNPNPFIDAPGVIFAAGRTPLIANILGSCPGAATGQALLGAGADPSHLLRGAYRR